MGTEADGTGTQALINKINELLHEGNVRRIVVTDRTGRTVLDVPVNAGVVVAIFAPVMTAAGAALALAGGWHISVENTRQDTENTPPDVVDAES